MIVALTMWTAVIIFGIADFKTESTRWAMALTFFAGLSDFSIFWSENPTLLVQLAAPLGLTIESHEIIEAVLSAITHYFTPYSALVFGLSYSEVLNPKYKKVTVLLLLIPMVITFLIYPTHDYRFQSSQSHAYYCVLSIWAVPYSLISCIAQIYAYLKEDIPSKKRERLTFCLIAVPGIAITSVTNYLLGGLPAEGPKYWSYNVYVILYMFVMFLFCLIRNGVLGIRLRLEKQNLNSMMTVLNSGMKILSHSLKNEITKISICLSNIRFSLEKSGVDLDDFNENIQMVSASLAYLSDFVKEMQRNALNSENFPLTQNNLGTMIEAAMKSLAVFLKAKSIQMEININPMVSVLSNKVYLQEVFVNIFQNAIEAMDIQGRLRVETSLTSRGLFVTIKDNGAGIAKEDLPRIMEPFFTTKDKKHNLGLGLTYCYNMLRMHGASLEVESERNIGTTISMFFPKNKIILSNTENLANPGVDLNIRAQPQSKVELGIHRHPGVES